MEFPQEGHEPDTPGLLFDKHIQKWNFSCLSNIFRKLERFKWDFQEHEEADTRVNGKFCRVSSSPKYSKLKETMLLTNIRDLHKRGSGQY